MNVDTLKVRISKFQYLAGIMTIVIVFGATTIIDTDYIGLIDIINVLLLIYVVFLFLRMIFNPIYIQFDNNQLIINQLHIPSKTVINLKDIVELKIEINPFYRSYVKLKDGSKVKFDTNGFKDDDVLKLKSLIEKVGEFDSAE